ncbi:hypothetical protein LLEC1_07283 [Akanthomyces lecanii]|uniref:Aminoacyl-transfer RNA synthetases class-II family profile domain-containing protein n=1 Tax=Cordyceps confragosa TaxID=2714763 RepID=A0A179IIJ1_CORDF|nr:hypothetical protein LLEC1_07283 [Akanthomyces lecanii]
MFAARALRGSRWRRYVATRRTYSVSIPGDSPARVKTIADLKEFQSAQPVSDVQVCGWVRSVRKSAGVRFVDVTDGSSMRPIQAVVDKSLATDIRPGSAVRFLGTWEQGSGIKHSPSASSTEEPMSESAAHELQVQHVNILGSSNPQTPESLRTISHLRSRTPMNSTLLRFRSDATALLTQFFFREQFQQTHPPIITSSDCEGAGEAFMVQAAGNGHFFRDPKYLTVSTQLHLESLAQALGDVWTLSPTFRAEKSDTSRHLSEFQMLEAEMSFVNSMDDVMNLAQRMLVSLTTAEQFDHKPVWGAGLQSEHEKFLAEKVGYDEANDAYLPIYITQYPREIKAFYMLKATESPTQGQTVDCFDLLVPGLGELAGGSMREHRLPELEESMRLHGLPVPNPRQPGSNNLSWYLDLRRWGCPPHGGFGLGFDRLLSYLTGVTNVRDVVPFPRHFERCDC